MAIHKLLAVFLCSILTACATATQPDPEFQALMNKLEPTDATVRCIPGGSRSVSIQAATQTQVLLRQGSNRWYLGEGGRGCAAAGEPHTRVQYVLRGDGFCSPQSMTIIDNSSGAIKGVCVLRGFQVLRPKQGQEN